MADIADEVQSALVPLVRRRVVYGSVPIDPNRRTCMRKALAFLALLTAGVVSGCGGGGEEAESEGGGETTHAACTGSALSESLKLPASWPQIESDKMVYTEQETKGPTEVVEGYFNGSVQEAHDEFQHELEASGFTVTFEEVEEHDSEVAWEGEGRTGIVAIRDECGDSDKMYIRITNRAE